MLFRSTKTRQWNLGKLSSRENPLVIFTLTTQAVIGAFLIAFFGSLAGSEGLSTLTKSSLLTPLLLTLIGLQGFVLFLSTRHLGKPWRFYRGFNNLRHSPLSREALGISMFFGFMLAVTGLTIVDRGFPGWFASGSVLHYINIIMPWFDAALVGTCTDIFVYLAAIAGLLGLYCMHSIYRIKARPFWDHWQVLASFFGTMFSLGALLIGLVCVPLMLWTGKNTHALLTGLTGFIAFGLALESFGHIFHARYLRHEESEAAASYYLLTTQYGNTYIARNILLGVCLSTVFILSVTQIPAGWQGVLLWTLLAGTMLLTALVSRALFYVIVIPTTMPGAFFWKNKGFEEHARKTGLARLPQVGVLQATH